jgi:hypothetical protein
MTWPPGKVQDTVHPRIGADPAVTVTSPWKPPDQELVTAYAARAPGAGLGGVLGSADGDTLAEAETEADAEAEAEADMEGDGVTPGRAARYV